jgi:hypothetical protein
MTLRFSASGLAISLLFVVSGGTAAQNARQNRCATITAENTDDCVRLNEIQVLGTHNSYHIAPEPKIMAEIGERARDIEYTHKPLAEQLSRQGIRKFELDVFTDPEGGRFAKPWALQNIQGLDPIGPEMLAPGFKVIHTQDVDFRSTCSTLTKCLTTIRDWSRSNSWHVPIMVMIEAKDAPIKDRGNIRFVQPLRVGAAEFRALDAEIRSVFSEDHMLTPDDVRGKHATLWQAIESEGWPTLKASRGKVLFALDNTDDHITDYLGGRAALEGRVLFVSSEPGQPSAGFLKLNEAIGPLGNEEQTIRKRVLGGFLIRTRADIPTAEARSGSTVRRDAAFRSGAHFVSTDYPVASPFGSGYVARLPGGEHLTARCNPVNAPSGCRNEWLERPR